MRKAHVELDVLVDDDVEEEVIETDIRDLVNGEEINLPYDLEVDGEVVVEKRS